MNDDIDIDKIFDENTSLKPLSDGLGFHHSLKKKEDVQVSLKAKSKSLDDDLKKRVSELRKQKQKSKQFSENNKSSFANNATMGDLSVFYNDKSRDDELSTKEDVRLSTRPDENYASDITRISAFCLDFVILSSIFTSIITLSFMMAGYNLEMILLTAMDGSYYLELGFLYSLIFVFYFSFFDRTLYSTPGKKALSIRVKSVDRPLSFSQSLMRSVIVLLGFLTFGLLGLLKFQDKLTSTKVINS